MSSMEIRSTVPRGAVAFLQRLRASTTALDGGAYPDRARTWCRRQGFATCRVAPRGDWPPSDTGWLYEITAEGRSYLDAIDKRGPESYVAAQHERGDSMMAKRMRAAGNFAKDCLWMLPIAGGLAIVLLFLARCAGVGYAAVYIVALILLLTFNAGAHCKGRGRLPPDREEKTP